MDSKEIKKEARINLKNNYIMNVLVVFLCGLLIYGGVNSSTKSIRDVNVYNKNDVKVVNRYNSQTNSEAIDELLKKTGADKKLEKKMKHDYNQGIISGVVNEVFSTKSVAFTLVDTVNKFLGGNMKVAHLILFTNLIVFIISTLFLDVIEIGRCRYFLEERRYTKTYMTRILFPYKKKKFLRLSLILYAKEVFTVLWAFTIVGLPIKLYEYSMIPYILAENPDMKFKEVFKTSKEMMKGHKWQLFKMEFSLIGYKILSMFTFGLVDLFYTNVYIRTIQTEFYARVRELKYDELTHKDKLNDDKLFIKERVEGVYEEKTPKKSLFNIDYDKLYSLNTYILFFFTFSFVGWFYEVMIHIVKDGEFVNRGTMYGPWLPIYGVGGVAILFFLKRFRKNGLQMFIASILLCGILEYTGSWLLETFKHLKYWDYSGYFFNIQGRVCLEGLIVFGLGGCCFTYIVGPILDNFYNKYDIRVRKIIAYTLLFIFSIDFIISTFIRPNTGKGITDYQGNNRLELNDYT